MTKPVHQLSDKNVAERTAVCAICGPVKLHKNGRRFTCAEKQRIKHAEWAKRNPEKARANRAQASPHRVSGDQCLVCGTVEPVAYGRGWACPNTKAVLRRELQQVAPTPRCSVCRHWAGTERPVTAGLCRPCADAELVQVMALAGLHEPQRWHEVARRAEVVAEDMWGLHDVDPDTDDPYYDEPASVVPGWRVIGTDEVVHA
jgi:hypothetical protein